MADAQTTREPSNRIKRHAPGVAVGVVLAGIGGLISIGAFPRISDIYTQQDADAAHAAIVADNERGHKAMREEMARDRGDTEEIKNMIREYAQDQGKQIKELDARVWQILQEVRR